MPGCRCISMQGQNNPQQPDIGPFRRDFSTAAAARPEVPTTRTGPRSASASGPATRRWSSCSSTPRDRPHRRGSHAVAEVLRARRRGMRRTAPGRQAVRRRRRLPDRHRHPRRGDQEGERARRHTWVAERVYDGIPASRLGREQRIEVGAGSGRANILYWLDRHRIEPDEAVIASLTEAIARADRTYSDEELLAIASAVAPARPSCDRAELGDPPGRRGGRLIRRWPPAAPWPGCPAGRPARRRGRASRPCG